MCVGGGGGGERSGAGRMNSHCLNRYLLLGGYENK